MGKDKKPKSASGNEKKDADKRPSYGNVLSVGFKAINIPKFWPMKN